MTTTAPAELIGTADAAKLLGVTRGSVNAWINRGKIKPIGVIGRRGIRVFDRASIEALAFAEKNRRAGR